jgi:hypothetical protein
MAKGIKTGGREAGTPNRNTAEMRELINQFISNNWERVQTDFDKLEPKDRLQFFERLMQYSVPKLQSVNHEFELEAKLEKLTEDELDGVIEKLSETIGIPKRKAKFPEWFNEGGTP